MPDWIARPTTDRIRPFEHGAFRHVESALVTASVEHFAPERANDDFGQSIAACTSSGGNRWQYGGRSVLRGDTRGNGLKRPPQQLYPHIWPSIHPRLPAPLMRGTPVFSADAVTAIP